jgi:acyl carrier protein phosphodiesterase
LSIAIPIEVIVSIITTVVSVGVAVASLGYWLGKKFTEIDYRFRLIDERFNAVNERFKAIDARFEQIDKKFDELEKRIVSRIERVALAFAGYQEFLVEFLSREGVIKGDARELLVREARRVAGLALANPLTKEEWEKVLKYIDKKVEEFTLEEAEEFVELARKVALEYGDRPEAWKLHILAALTLGLVLRRYREMEEKEKKQAEEQKK